MRRRLHPLPQHGDMKRFREVTWGPHHLMGRRTFESLPQVLSPERHNIVVRPPGRPTNPTLPPGLRRSPRLSAIAAAGHPDEIMIIGGGEIYSRRLSAP